MTSFIFRISFLSQRIYLWVSEIARPLTGLTRAVKEFDWKAPQQSAFIRLKMALATAPTLLLPDFELPFFYHH